ncbi:pentapeptide repeat-containing protein [Leptolyngbya sp. Heron Island J]|uniref:pentapeptide repeat-containing protein n=1 Tax=Leptolyngbya sp. Heron Island J TaxID=1385935 RepID=UPI0003B98CA6|nr:pentapeptide repeat-containing protein [Leptolyngbya sp. Heron Island J]ESA35950.1 pentapeptide repeat-containing protein [Leptolyngbya sp. Heron Island J]
MVDHDDLESLIQNDKVYRLGPAQYSDEHLEILKQGVEAWNRWREENPDLKPEFSRVNLRGFDCKGANFENANFSYAELRGCRLEEANLSKTNLYNAFLRRTNLSRANLCKSNLDRAYLHAAHLDGANLIEANLNTAILSRANLSHTILCGADLSVANLNGSNLAFSDLSNTNLTAASLINACLDNVILTGACIRNWNITSDTSFIDIKCDYVFLKSDTFSSPRTFRERLPRASNAVFKSGEFEALIRKTVDTVDLIFIDGIDWQAFFQSFQELRSQYADENLSIQGIERKQGEAFVVRLEVPEGADKPAIESRAKELYAAEIKVLEAQYEERLRLQGQHLEDARQTIEIERREKATLMGVMTTMANNQQGPKYDMRGSQFNSGFIETNYGTQSGGTINNQAAETPSLAEAAAEIQNLLKQLEMSNPTATEADQTAYLNALIPPTKRERFIGALKSAGGAAIEEVPYGAVLKALVEGWQKPGE